MPHYLGGKLGRSSSRSIFPSVHLTSPCTPPPPRPSLPPFSLALRSLDLLVSSSRVKKGARVCHPLSLALLSLLLCAPLTRTRTLSPGSPRLLYTVHLRIGSLSTRGPPPSPLPYGPIVVFSSPSLPPSPPPSPPPFPLLLDTPPHHHPNSLRSLRTERACDNLLGRSSGPRGSSFALSSRC